MEPLRNPAARERRLDEDRVHVFALREYVDALRDEPQYREHGHTGVTLVKTEDLRTVLAVAEPGASLSEHVIRGPATVQVLEGSLDLEMAGEVRTLAAGDVAVLPHDEIRTLTARERSAFVLSLALRS